MRCGLLRMIVMRNITESLYISVFVYESITSVCNILYTQKQLMNMWIIDFCKILIDIVFRVYVNLPRGELVGGDWNLEPWNFE